jgi:hypothetical protein
MTKMNYFYGIIASAAFLSAACSAEEPARLAQSLTSGERIMVSLTSDGNGQLEASAIGVEDDDIDCEQEGEHEGENEGCVAADPVTTAKADVIVANVSANTLASDLRVLDIGIQLDAEGPLAAGTYWFSGDYQGEGVFAATVQKTGDIPYIRVLSVVQEVTVNDDGTVTLMMLDKEINVAGNLSLTEVESLEEATDAEDDGIECEQEGEHEGENEGENEGC